MYICKNPSGTWRAFEHQSESARFLGVSAQSVSRWIEAGAIGVKAANRGMEFYSEYSGIRFESQRGTEAIYRSDRE